MIIRHTLMRSSFIGGGTDYPVQHREHGGSVLSTTNDKSCSTRSRVR
jgi:galactokinase/mevalonate kinase-like predicted kinase